MTDDKKPDPPLKKPKVDVKVSPVTHPVKRAPEEKKADNHRMNQENDAYAEKVKKNLTDQVKKAVQEAAPAGGDKQFEAAKKAADDAARQINGEKIKKVTVTVTDTTRERTTEHVPSEGASE